MKQPRIIRTDGTEIPYFPKSKSKGFTLDELKKAIRKDENDDPFIQVVPMRTTGQCLVCDEDGINKGLAQNSIATVECALDVIIGPDGIRGNVLICPEDMIQ